MKRQHIAVYGLQPHNEFSMRFFFRRLNNDDFACCVCGTSRIRRAELMLKYDDVISHRQYRVEIRP